MSMYLPNPDVGPIGVEPIEFLEPDDLSSVATADRPASFAAGDDAEDAGNGVDRS